MEDEWYSGDSVDGFKGYGSNVPSGVGAGIRKGGGRTYGDSFTPPSSKQGMVGNEKFGDDYGGMSGVGGGLGIGGPAVGGGLNAEDGEDYENEPPLMEELEINFEHIWSKTMAVILPTKSIDINYLDNTDLAGPLVFCLCFGMCLLFKGKLHFGYIYGFGAFGCIATTCVLNLMGDKPIDVWKTGSILGYCLLPVILLAAVNIAVDLTGVLGQVLGTASVLWCTFAATRLFEEYLGMRQQRYLVAYPVCLLYWSFVLITIY